MSRFLFVVPPLVGHIAPTLGVGAQLLSQGHQVAWCGFRRGLESALPVGGIRYPAGGAVAADALQLRHREWLGLRGFAELKFFWADFLLPMAEAMLPGVTAAVDAFGPDVVICDQQALAGPIAARGLGLTWAVSASTSAELAQPLARVPKVQAWVDEAMDGLQRRHGAPDPVDLRWSSHLNLVFSSRLLTGQLAPPPGPLAFVGPAPAAATDDSVADFPWDWLDPGRRTVLASLGTLNAESGARFYAALIEGLRTAGDRLQLVVVAPDGLLDDPPAHVLIRSFVPQRALLPRVDAVVSHGGHNTVCEVLAHGIPLVVAPIRSDQPIVAQQVVAAEAGIGVSFARVRPAQLAAAVTVIVDEDRYRRAARRVADSFGAAGGAARAADLLAELAHAGRTQEAECG